MYRPILAIPSLQNITPLVRIQPPAQAWIGARWGYVKPQCFEDSRDSKNDSIFGARREMQRRRHHAPSCMGASACWYNTRVKLSLIPLIQLREPVLNCRPRGYGHLAKLRVPEIVSSSKQFGVVSSVWGFGSGIVVDSNLLRSPSTGASWRSY